MGTCLSKTSDGLRVSNSIKTRSRDLRKKGTSLILSSDFQKEEINLIHSQRDVKSAVGRLNAIFMVLYLVVVVLVISICLVGR